MFAVVGSQDRGGITPLHHDGKALNEVCCGFLLPSLVPQSLPQLHRKDMVCGLKTPAVSTATGTNSCCEGDLCISPPALQQHQ